MEIIENNLEAKKVTYSDCENIIIKDFKKVEMFVCAMSYNKMFFRKFAELAKPLMDLSTLHPLCSKVMPVLCMTQAISICVLQSLWF